jgi:hypothetical protein
MVNTLSVKLSNNFSQFKLHTDFFTQCRLDPSSWHSRAPHFRRIFPLFRHGFSQWKSVSCLCWLEIFLGCERGRYKVSFGHVRSPLFLKKHFPPPTFRVLFRAQYLNSKNSNWSSLTTQLTMPTSYFPSLDLLRCLADCSCIARFPSLP